MCKTLFVSSVPASTAPGGGRFHRVPAGHGARRGAGAATHARGAGDAAQHGRNVLKTPSYTPRTT